MNLSKFHSLTNDAFKDAKLSLESFAEEILIYSEGENLDYIRFIVEGEIAVLKSNNVVWKGHQNEFIGLSSYFNQKGVYGNSAKTTCKTEIVKIKKEDFEKALNSSSELSNKIIQSLLKRIKYTSENVVEAEQMIKKRRLGFY